MSDLGQLLKKARVEKGMTLDDIQDLTKIRKRYLEAIEEGDYKVLPGTFYVRAFVKTYAETVGLNPDELLQLYSSDIPEAVTETASVEPLIQKRRSSQKQRSDRAGKWISSVLMWSFLILIVVVVYFFYLQNAKPDASNKVDTGTPITDEKTPPAKTDPNTPDKVETKPEDTPPVTPEVVAPTIVPSGKAGKADRIKVQLNDDQPVQVEVTASGGSGWLNVYKKAYKGEVLFDKMLNDGETQTFELGEGLYIRINRADYMEVKIGGVPLEDGNVAAAKRFLLQPERKAGTATDSSATP